jgi:Fic-DOC domain mobile mystery protein B
VTGNLGKGPPGSTPLDLDDLEGLIPTWVATVGDLNLAEQANIEKASVWLFRRRVRILPDVVLTDAFSRDLHRRMFDDVWRWAGTSRLRETTPGVDPVQISTEVRVLLGDARYWHENSTYPVVERAVRLHHRLVWIHPFRNGNGRHSRLMADAYLSSVGEPRLPWGGSELFGDDEFRRTYISALRAADRGDYEALVEFATSG